MSEQHPNTTPQTGNGSAPTTRTKKEIVAKSAVVGSVVTYTFTNGETAVCDVSKLPPKTLLEYAVEGVRNSGRLAFQKMEDPARAALATRTRFEKMLSGDTTKTSRRAAKETDALTQALVKLTGKSVEFITETWFPRYFASKDSGCTTNTVNGKTRMYGKNEALARLTVDPGIKPEYDKIVRERAATVAKATPTKRLDLNSVTA